MNIVFLDIDGVLNSMSYFDSIKGKRSRTNNEIDESKVVLLKKILNENKAFVVLSSTWRDLEDSKTGFPLAMWNYLKDTLCRYGIGIFSKTPIIDYERPLEIKAWLECNSIDKWISLDDDFSEEQYEKHGLGGHLVKTTFYGDGGLHEEHVRLARELFEKQ